MRFTLVSLALVAQAGLAHADDRAARAAKLFDEGRRLATLGQHAEACRSFEQSFELDPAVGTKLNIADCLEKENKLSEAWRAFTEVAIEYDRPETLARARFARDRAKALEPLLVHVVVVLAAPIAGTKVTIGGRNVVPALETQDRVAPGQVEIVVTSIEGKREAVTTTARAGERVTIDLAAPHTTQVGPRDRRRVRLAAGLAGGGVLATLVGSVFALSARSKKHDAFANGDCMGGSPPLCNEVGTATLESAGFRANVATAMFVGGVGLVGAGVTLYLLAPREHSTGLVPITTRDTIGLALGGEF